MMDFIWKLRHEAEINEARNAAADARSQSENMSSRIVELETTLQRMSLVSQALWEIVRERLNISEEELLKKVNEVDLRDGTLDQRITPRALACPKCGRTLSARNNQCYYCGAAVKKPNVFQ